MLEPLIEKAKRTIGNKKIERIYGDASIKAKGMFQETKIKFVFYAMLINL